MKPEEGNLGSNDRKLKALLEQLSIDTAGSGSKSKHPYPGVMVIFYTLDEVAHMLGVHKWKIDLLRMRGKIEVLSSEYWEGPAITTDEFIKIIQEKLYL